MSHQHLIDTLNESQVARLIELAQAKLSGLKNSGWVYLWVVAHDTNHAWYAESDYRAAVEGLGVLGEKFLSAGDSRELSLELVPYRPVEAVRLLAQKR